MRLFIIAAVALTLSCTVARAADEGGTTPPVFHIDHPGLKKLSWQLLCQASTFHELSVMEAIYILHANNFHHIELSPGQLLTRAANEETKVYPEMGSGNIKDLHAELKDAHMDIVSYGIADFGRGEADARKVFEFAKAIQVKNIIATPARDSLELLDKLAIEYQINVAILNQPSSPYADGNAMLQAMKERSTRIGVCADIVDWRRAGQDPLDCVRKLKGRIFEVHLKDSSNPQEATAVSDVLKELAQQKFKGAFCVQTEKGSRTEVLKNLAAVVNGFSDVVTTVAATAP